MKKPIKVKKFSGELVDFDESKLVNSLKAAQADHNLATKDRKRGQSKSL